MVKDKQFCMSCLIEICSSGSSISVFNHYLNWNVIKDFVPLLHTPTSSTTHISDDIYLFKDVHKAMPKFPVPGICGWRVY